MTTNIKRENESLLSEISFDRPEEYANNDEFAFQAFGCVVLEKAVSDKHYDYVATNLRGRKSALISHRRTPLRHDDADVTAFLRKLMRSHVAGKARLAVDSETSLPAERLREVMSAIFHETLPRYGYTVRDGQVELAERILDTAANRGTLLAEAAVGIGKTLAYMTAAVLAKRGRLNEHWNTAYFPEMSVVEWRRMPVMVSTSSIALQRAIDKEVIPMLSNILLAERVIKSPLRSLLLKGKSHYICEHKLLSHLPYEKKPDIAATLERLAYDCTKLDLADVEGLTPHIKDKICVPAKCYSNCPHNEVCRYRDFRDSVRKGDWDVIVTNHNLLLTDAKVRAKSDRAGAVLPPYQFLVIDEAHEFEQAARSTYGAVLESNAIGGVVKTIDRLHFAPLFQEGNEDWREVRTIIRWLANELRTQNGRLFEHETVDAECGETLTTIRNIIGELRYDLNKCHILKSALDEERKNSLLWSLERLDANIAAVESDDENIRWFEEKGDAALYALPKNLSGLIERDLWNRGVPAVLTSGTLSVSGDFGALKRSLGLENVKKLYETTQASPYDYRKNALLYISENVPHYRASGYVPALTDELEQLIRITNGHTAVLFTSYATMNIVYDNLVSHGLTEQFSFFKLERSTSNAIERFKRSKEQTGKQGVLFACGSMWEGIDIPGDALSSLIIVKLPFPMPDAISEYERTRYRSNREFMDKAIFPATMIKAKQGTSRGLRTETDTCVFAILDCRVGELGIFRLPFLAAMPDFIVTSDVMDIEEFLRRVKRREYWY